MRRELILLGLIVFFIVVIGVPDRCNAADSIPFVSEVCLTDVVSDKIDIDMYQDKVVWVDKRDGNWDIFMYDLTSQQEVRITNDPTDQFDPKVCGNRIVWLDNRNALPTQHFDIYTYDLNTGVETKITETPSVIHFACDEDLVAWIWMDNDDSRYNVSYSYFGEAKPIFLYQTNNVLRAVDTHSKRILWEEQVPDPNYGLIERIWLEDIVFNTRYSANWPTLNIWNIKMYNDLILCENVRPATPEGGALVYDLFIFDTKTMMDTRITPASGGAGCLGNDIYGSIVVWSDVTSPGILEVYDYSTGLTRQVYSDNPKYENVIYEDKVAWLNDSGVFVGTLDPALFQDTEPPFLTSAVLTGQILTLTYNELLNTDSVPLASDFMVKCGETPISVENVEINGGEVILTLAEPAVGTTIILDYTPGASPIQDLMGNSAAELIQQSVIRDETSYLLQPSQSFTCNNTINSDYYISLGGACEYAIYHDDGLAVIDRTDESEMVTVPGHSRMVVTNTALEGYNVVGPSDLFVPKASDNPAAKRIELSPGSSCEALNLGDSMRVIVGGDYEISYYHQPRDFNVWCYTEPEAEFWFPPSMLILMTNVGLTTYEVIGPYEVFNPVASDLPAIKYVDLQPGESIEFENPNGFGSYIGGKFDYVEYGSDNSFYRMERAKSCTTPQYQFSVGYRTVFTNADTQAFNVYAGGRSFLPANYRGQALAKINLEPGEIIEFYKDNNSFPIDVGGACDYTKTDSNGTTSRQIPNAGRLYCYESDDYGTITNIDKSKYEIYGPSELFFPSRVVNAPQTGLSASTTLQTLQGKKMKMAIGELVAEPVDTATGAHVLSNNLLTLQGNPSISLELQYNSLLLNPGIFGRGWCCEYEVWLEELEDRSVKVHWNSNRVNTFTANETEGYTAQEAAIKNDWLSKQDDGTFILVRNDQQRYEFSSSGQLLRYFDGFGHSLTMSNDTSNRLVGVSEDLSGQSLSFAYNDNGLVERAFDSANRQVGFVYDTSQNLVEITDVNGYKTNYTYNADGQVLTCTKDKTLVFSNIYDDQGRLSSQKDAVPSHNSGTFTYDDISSPGELITTYTDRNGNSKVYVYNADYHLLTEIDEIGSTTSYTYDNEGNRTSMTDAMGNTTSYTYDSRGNLLTVTDPADNVTTMAYDDCNNVLFAQNAAEKTMTYAYDNRNNLLRQTDPEENTTSFTYNGDGLKLSKTNPAGTTSYTYENGRLHTVTDPLGNTTTFGYDAAGRLIQTIDAKGKSSFINYDNSDNIISITDALGNTVSYTYDAFGNKLTQTDARGNTTRYTYNGNGKLISSINPLNYETRYEYDGEDRLVKVIDANGHATSTNRDGTGKVTAVIDATGRTVATNEYNEIGQLTAIKDAYGIPISAYTYDPVGNILSVTDAMNHTSSMSYDQLNRLINIADAKGQRSTNVYDDLNRLCQVSNPANGIARQTFDAIGNVLSSTDPNNNTTQFSYDKNGNLINTLTASGSNISWEYDYLNRMKQSANGRGQTSTYDYDDANRVTAINRPEGSTSFCYDDDGNLLTIINEQGTISREYDSLNRITKYTDTRGNTIQYSYDNVGNLLSLTYPDNKQVSYEYDAANRLIKVSDWADRVTLYEYDDNGRLLKTTRSDGSIQIQSYNSAGWLIKQVDTAANNQIIAQFDYSYDENSNITAEVSSIPELPPTPANITMTYSADNRLADYNGEPVNYDADGNMTRGPLDNQMTDFTYDSLNRLSQVGDNTTCIYDAEGNRVEVRQGTESTSYIINPHALLSQLLMKEESDGTKTYYVYGQGLIGEENAGQYRSYHYDLRGSTIALTDEQGEIIDRYWYGPYGELVKHEGSANTQFLYNGRDGVMTDHNGLYYMRARYYNPDVKRFVNRDILPGSIENGQTMNRFAYLNGQVISKVDPFGLSPMDSDVKLSKLRYLQYLWENVKDVYVRDTTGRWLDADCANLESFERGDYGTGIKARSIMVTKHAFYTTSWVLDIMPMNMSNPAKAGKAINRTYFDVKYGENYEGKNQNDALWDVAAVPADAVKMGYFATHPEKLVKKGIDIKVFIPLEGLNLMNDSVSVAR